MQIYHQTCYLTWLQNLLVLIAFGEDYFAASVEGVILLE